MNFFQTLLHDSGARQWRALQRHDHISFGLRLN
jgi:hypothetical protein